MTLSEGALRRTICSAGSTLYARGLIGPTDGNFSARVGDRYLVCTPSGVHKGKLQPEDLVKLTLDGRVVSGSAPSSELKMHLAIYRLRPDIRAIVHAHPPCAVGLTVAGVSLEVPVVPEILFAVGAVPNVPYASPTTSDVPDAIAPVVQRCDAFMMARHGSVVLCDTMDNGVIKTEIIEHTAKITLAARIAGGASPLPQAEVDKLLRLAQEARMTPVHNIRKITSEMIVNSPGSARRQSDQDAVEDLARRVIAKLRG
ncbi:MAG: class II aldolase/adducin family protein [Deltaproteobacteria bacterium]|nr:class II aldolase/adducin family protein [Deltaproteobacteria bacterium]